MATKSTVLVVDDTPENIHILMDLFKRDYAVLTAKDGKKALQLAQLRKPDIILLDIVMPGMDGYMVIHQLKADEKTRDIPVIFITALGEVEDETVGLELGAIDYIAKPFNPDIVKARVKNHLALRQAVRLKEDVERIMRHDLKSPLTAVISLPQLLLRDDNLTADQREMLSRIEDAGYTLLSMVNLSTALFKMEGGGYTLSPEAMDLAGVVRKVYAGVEDSAQMHGLALRLVINGREANAGEPFEIEGEELLCYSMLANLITNALEASPDNAAITVSLERSPDDSVTVCIHNKGEVPATIQERFFEKYVTAGKTQGTGLGTYSARLIAHAHGGAVTLESAAGDVRVVITLPARQVRA